MSRTDRPAAMNLPAREFVEKFRANERAIRRLQVSKPTRRMGRTLRALAVRLDTRATWATSAAFLPDTERTLLGKLTEEASLTGRILAAEVPDVGLITERRAVRTRISDLVGVIESR